MELQTINNRKNTNIIENKSVGILGNLNTKPFIVANTKEVGISHLKDECTIPVFAKDNEVTISHQEFIESIKLSAMDVFHGERILEPQVRVSHVIKGRIPEAIKKPAKELMPHEKTIYYERMAFLIDISSIQQEIGGNRMSLSVGGVRAYNQENLYSKKTIEKFKVFVGFKNWVCTNLCVSSDGYVSELRVSSLSELKEKVSELLYGYNSQAHLNQLATFTKRSISEQQFAHLLGKARLYNYLPKSEKAQVPLFSFTDGQINAIAKDYYLDENFGRGEDGSISLWKLYNLFTGANKSSYIDSFVERNVNAHNFTNSISEALRGNSDYHWFLS